MNFYMICSVAARTSAIFQVTSNSDYFDIVITHKRCIILFPENTSFKLFEASYHWPKQVYIQLNSWY